MESERVFIGRGAIISGALLATALTATARVAPQEPKPPSLLPNAPQSDARWAPIERFKKVAPPLARSYEARTYRKASGEAMPYRMFRPRVEPGRRYPLVLFLHGSSVSGADNVKQLDGANGFGGLVWALPENQERHPCFVVAPQSNENWPAVRLIEGQWPEILPGPGRADLATLPRLKDVPIYVFRAARDNLSARRSGSGILNPTELRRTIRIAPSISTR